MLQKIILIAFFAIFSFGSMERFATQNNYYLSYQEALTLSQQTKKPILMVVVTTTCPWCEKLKKQTLQKQSIKEIVAKNYIPLIVNKEASLYPKQRYEAKVVPTVHIISGETQEIIQSSFGYKTEQKFLEFLEKNHKGTL